MNAQFHAPSFGDEIFDLCEDNTSTPNTSAFVGNQSNNNINSYTYQQQTSQSETQTKRMISLHNTSDEYHTANDESFNQTANNSMNSIVQQTATTSNVLQAQMQQPQIGGNLLTTSTVTTPTTMAARKQVVPSEQTEPSKPLSAYALFFRDTVSAIKQQNPTCSFQELSRIVASMWDVLDPVHKGVYNKKSELAKMEYLKQMKIYQQQQQQKRGELNQMNSNEGEATTDTEYSPTQQQTAAHQQMTPTMNVVNNQQQQPQQQQNAQLINNNVNTTNSSMMATSGAPSDEQMRLLTEAGSVQKCTRENCNKRAIINPDWEDEYCSNECVVIHCRNVFNAWVQSNLEARQQQQQSPTQ